MQISGSTALVTGANRGLGRALTDELVARGATVYAGARDPGSITDDRVSAVRLDVTDPASITAAAALATDVDLVINNAGVSEATPAFGPDGVDALQRLLEVNTFGPLRVTNAFAPVLAANGGGAIVNVLSVLSWVTGGAMAGYSASKAAAWSLTNATRGELKGQGTQVVGVHVGYLDTDMAAHVDGPKTDPVALARQILDAVEAGEIEVLGDDLSRAVKSGLSGSPEALAI